MDKILQRHKLMKLKQEETENFNRLIADQESKLVIKKLSTK